MVVLPFSMSALLCDRMGRPARRNRQKTEMMLYAGHIRRFQAETGKTNPVALSADTPPRPRKTGCPSPVPPIRQSSPAGFPPAGGFPAMNRTSPPRFPSRCFPENAPFPSPVPFSGDGTDSRTGKDGRYPNQKRHVPDIARIPFFPFHPRICSFSFIRNPS